MTSRLATVLVLATSVAPGCVQGEWRRINVGEPITNGQLDALQPGHDDLASCLAALGAPWRVWEYADRGVALSYGWQDETRWGIRVSYSLVRLVSVSYSYDQTSEAVHGVVLLLGSDLRLREVRRGYLNEITKDLERRRPATLEEIEGPTAP